MHHNLYAHDMLQQQHSHQHQQSLHSHHHPPPPPGSREQYHRPNQQSLTSHMSSLTSATITESKPQTKGAIEPKI